MDTQINLKQKTEGLEVNFSNLSTDRPTVDTPRILGLGVGVGVALDVSAFVIISLFSCSSSSSSTTTPTLMVDVLVDGSFS